MKKKKSATKKKQAKRKDQKQGQRTYREPRTAAELKIKCAACGSPAEWFDPDRASKDHMQGFICSREQKGAGSKKLLVRSPKLVEDRPTL
jgi:cytochrome c peroxidase